MELEGLIPAPEVETPIDPESIAEARHILTKVADSIEAGELELLTCYVGLRDGRYQIWTNRNNGRHEDAGRMMEAMMIRLGFVQQDVVSDMIDES